MQFSARVRGRPLAMHTYLGTTLFCACALAVIWFQTWQRISFEHAEMIRSAMQANANLAIAIEEQTIRTLKAAEQFARFVHHAQTADGSNSELRGLVEAGQLQEEIFSDVCVFDAAGQLIASRHAGSARGCVHGVDLKNPAGLSKAGFQVGRPVLQPDVNSWRIPLASVQRDPDGALSDTVVMMLNPEYFTALTRRADIGRSGIVTLAGLDGIVRARRIGDKTTHGEDISRSAVFEQMASEPVGTLVGPGRIDGMKRIFSYRTLRDYPMVVVVGTAYEEQMVPYVRRRADYLSFASLCSLLVVAGSVLLVRTLLRQRRYAEALRDREAQYRATFHHAGMGILHLALDGRMQRVNQKFCDMLGYANEELLARSVFDVSDAHGRHSVRRLLRRMAADDGREATEIEVEKRYLRRDGSTLWVSETAGLVRDEQGRPDYVVAVSHDITARKLLEKKLMHEAHHDALTHLANRALFHDRLSQFLARARRHGTRAAVLYLDLDGFKQINDTWGHAGGDALLREVARRLVAGVRAEDTVARLGGDEFGLLLAEAGDLDACCALAGKLINALRQPVQLEQGEARISASVGIAIYPDDAGGAMPLLACADEAMFHAKRHGKSTFATYASLHPQTVS